jgi:hypothetical protein
LSIIGGSDDSAAKKNCSGFANGDCANENNVQYIADYHLPARRRATGRPAPEGPPQDAPKDEKTKARSVKKPC